MKPQIEAVIRCVAHTIKCSVCVMFAVCLVHDNIVLSGHYNINHATNYPISKSNKTVIRV